MFDIVQSQQIAAHIEAHPGIKTADLATWAFSNGILKYTSRISEARRLGYVIVAKRVSRRESRYTVTARPGDTQLSLN